MPLLDSSVISSAVGSDGCLGRTWARRTAWEALVLVREVGGDLKDLLSRGMGPHVKRSVLRRELWQSEYKMRVDLKPITSELRRGSFLPPSPR